MTPNTETILIFFVAFTGAAVLLQACILVAIFISIRKTAKSLSEVASDLKTTALPMIHTSRDLVERITPQVITITEGMATLTEKLKRESSGVSISVSEIMERVSLQTKRLDAMLTHALNTVEKANNVVESAVAAPVRQVNGVFAAFKAIVGTYRGSSKPVTPRTDPKPVTPRAESSRPAPVPTMATPLGAVPAAYETTQRPPSRP